MKFPNILGIFPEAVGLGKLLARFSDCNQAKFFVGLADNAQTTAFLLPQPVKLPLSAVCSKNTQQACGLGSQIQGAKFPRLAVAIALTLNHGNASALNTMQIFIKLLSGKTTCLDVGSADTIASVKHTMQSRKASYAKFCLVKHTEY